MWRWHLSKDMQAGTVSHARVWKMVTREQQSPQKHHHSPSCSVPWPVSHPDLFLPTSQSINHQNLSAPSPSLIPTTSHPLSRLTHLYSRANFPHSSQIDPLKTCHIISLLEAYLPRTSITFSIKSWLLILAKMSWIPTLLHLTSQLSCPSLPLLHPYAKVISASNPE